MNASNYGLLAPLALALTSVACLPDDTRAPPGELLVTVSADDALSAGFTSEDGWGITFSHFLVVLGDVDLDGDDCDVYSEAGYSRIFELKRASPQRVSLLYGLGPCHFGFQISAPAWDSLRAEGVSLNDEMFLRTPGSDAHASDAGVSVHIEGSATKLGISKSFNWSFRRFIEYNACAPESEEATRLGVVLSADQVTEVDLLIRGGALFQNARSEPEAPPRFEPFRAADDEQGNGDGDITLDELENSPLPPGAVANVMIEDLGDRVYLQLLHQIVQFPGQGSCLVRSSAERPDFGQH
jgi:hypothetical protein